MIRAPAAQPETWRQPTTFAEIAPAERPDSGADAGLPELPTKGAERFDVFVRTLDVAQAVGQGLCRGPHL